MGDQAAIGLADRLREVCPRVGRLKTAHLQNRREIRLISLPWPSSGEMSPGP